MGIRRLIYEYRNKGLYPLYRALWLWVKNRDVKYCYVNLKRCKEYKTSDTVFIFGSGPSVNNITWKQLEYIKSHDSFGINHIFLLKFPMTYYYLGYEPTSNASLNALFTKDVRSVYENTLWFVPTKVFYRLYHPRIIPNFFPPNVKMVAFDYPPAVNFVKDRPFCANDFERTLVYRSTMTLVLYIVNMLGYKNIVLMGVDLHTHYHYHDHIDKVKEHRIDKGVYNHLKEGSSFEDLLPKKLAKKRTMEEYYYAVYELYFKPRGVNLYVGNKGNMLSPRIPLYPIFE